MTAPAKLIFLCGKTAAGKSTLAKALAQRENAVLLVQDTVDEGFHVIRHGRP
jgi:tRNA A37 N6-isopentenylltransferase MiaA